jgi:hypothetical protein
VICIVANESSFSASISASISFSRERSFLDSARQFSTALEVALECSPCPFALMNRSLTKTAWAHRHWSQSRHPGLKTTIHGPTPNITHCAMPRDRMDDSKRIRRPFKQPEGRLWYCGDLHNAGAFHTETFGAAPNARNTISVSVGLEMGSEMP